MQNQSKPIKWEKVYIFISSTFDDMHAERDYLVKRVFPKLSEWCERRKLHMVDIDLRWGVTEADATQNRNVVKVCLNRIDQCRPFFVCLLGQRYGTIAEPKRVSEETMKNYPGLEDAISKGSSITELEILHSVISPFHSEETIEKEGYHRSEYAYFYFRDDSYLRSLPKEPWYLRKVYSDAAEKDERERNKLQTKRDELIQRIKHEKRPFHIYNATWSEGNTTPEIAMPLQCPAALEKNQERWRGDWYKYAGVRVDGLDVEEDPSEAAKAREFNEKLTRGRLADFKCDGEDLGDVIQRDLIQAVEQRFPDHKEIATLPELQTEIDQQEQFVFINSEGFIRRVGDFDELDDYVDSDSNKLFVLTAEAGMGKSMLLANWVDNYRRGIQNEPDNSIHFRFVGASDGSNTVYSLLRLLLREIKEAVGKLDDEIPDDPQKLRNALPGLLEQIGEHGKTVIVIDALNQLETGLSDLAWLPRQLPDNIKLIVSFKRGEEAAQELYDSLARDERVQLSEVKPFKDEADRRKLVAAYLDQYFKELDERHIGTLIGSPSAHNPLYLKVVLSEMRVFGAFAKLEEKIRGDFGDTPESAFEGMLQRLETDPAYLPIEPGEALPLIFGLLAHSRHGLAVEEFTSILLQALGMEDSPENRQDAKATVYFFLRQVRPFLARRGGRYDFFYESFRNAALKRYVAEEEGLPKRTSEDWHQLLADYFCGLPLWEKGEAMEEVRPRRKLPNSRKVAEQPYHLTGAHDWERLEGTLTDLRFIEGKCAAGMTYDLIADYNTALDALPEAQEERQKEREHEERVKKYTKDLIAYAKGEIEHLDIITSVEPWSDEKIREDTERIINNPTRLDRMRAFSQFVNSESHALVKFAFHPGFVLQQAYNSANCGPVASAAEGIVNTGLDDVLLLRHQSQRSDYNPHPALIKTLEGHTNWVNSVSLTPDGRRAVSGSCDNTVRVWDLESGKCLRVLEGHTDSINSISITPDAKRAISGSDDDTVRVWDLESGECLRTLEGHTDSVRSVSLTPDGRMAVSGSFDKTVRTWDLEGGVCINVLDGHTDAVNSVSITPDGKRAVSGSDDHSVLIWDLASASCLRVFWGYFEGEDAWDERDLPPGHIDSVLAVNITWDGKRVISGAGSGDNTIRVWDVESGECVNIIAYESEDIIEAFKSIAITVDGSTAISAGSQSLRVWDLNAAWDPNTGGCVKTLNQNCESSSVSLTPNGRIALSCEKKALQLWDLETGKPDSKSKAHYGTVSRVELVPGSKRAISANREYEPTRFSSFDLQVWDLETGGCVGTLKGHSNSINSLCVTSNGAKAISESEGSWTDKWKTRIWDLSSQEGIPYEKLYFFNCFCVTPDGKIAVFDGFNNTMSVWDIESRRCLKRLQGHTDSIRCARITSNCEIIISGSSDCTLRIWNLTSGECLRVLEGHTGEIRSISVTPDGKRAVSASSDDTVRFWDMETGHCLGVIRVQGAAVYEVAISADGTRIVAGNIDGELLVWPTDNQESFETIQGRADHIRCLEITEDGSMAVSGSDDGTIQVWDLLGNRFLKSFMIYSGKRSKEPLLLSREGQRVNRMSLSADGRIVLSVNDIGDVRLWDLEIGKKLCDIDDQLSGSWDIVRLAPDGKRAILVSSVHLSVWDIGSGELVKRTVAPQGAISIVVTTPDNRRAISVSTDRFLEIWDLDHGYCTAILGQLTSSVSSLKITPDGVNVVTADRGGNIRIWNLDSVQCTKVLQGYSQSIECLQISPQGNMAVARSEDMTLQVWDLESGECHAILEGHKSEITCVDVTPDGRKVVSGSRDGAIMVWDLSTGARLSMLFGHADYVESLVLTPDGRGLISASRDNSIRTWDLENMNQLSAFYVAKGDVSLSQMTASGDLVVGTGDGEVTILHSFNWYVAAPVTTPTRVYRYIDVSRCCWDDRITAVCQWCGQRFPVANEILNVITAINQDAKLLPDQSPCLELPAEAWEEPQLLSECPHCHKPLRFNPFIVDNSGQTGGVKKPALPREQRAKTTARERELLSEAETLFASDASEEVLARCEEYIQLNPECARIWILKGASLVRLDDYKEALSCYDRALQIDPKDADVWALRAAALYLLQSYKESLECSNKAIEIDPKKALAWAMKGNSLTKLRRYEEAVACYETGLQLDPEDADAWTAKAIALLALENYDDSLECSDKAIEIDPNSALAWSTKGGSLAALGRDEEALACCDRSMVLASPSAWLVNLKGALLFELDRYEEALACFERAIEIDPNFEPAKELREECLRRMRG